MLGRRRGRRSDAGSELRLQFSGCLSGSGRLHAQRKNDANQALEAPASGGCPDLGPTVRERAVGLITS